MYYFAVPDPLLRPFIESYWWIRAEAGVPLTLHERVFVDGKADLIFNFGVAYTREKPTLSDVPDILPASNFDAQRDYPVSIVQTGQVDLLAVRFRAGGWAALAALPAYELTNQTLAIGDVFGALTGELEAKLYEVRRSVQAQVMLLDAFFLARLQLPDTLRISQHIAYQLDQSGGMLGIGDLARTMGYSIRSIDRIFRQQYGITPKFYARIARMQQALALLARAPAADGLVHIALECGFYDHAHLTHEFQALTAHTPDSYRHYLSERRLAPPPNLVNTLNKGK